VRSFYLISFQTLKGIMEDFAIAIFQFCVHTFGALGGDLYILSLGTEECKGDSESCRKF